MVYWCISTYLYITNTIYMVIKKKEFESSHFDTIAVVYEVIRYKNHDGIEIVKLKPMKPNPMFNHYWFLSTHEYLIVCGQSEYKVKDNILERTFISKNHPLYNTFA